jgi:hypothetical protein
MGESTCYLGFLVVEYCAHVRNIAVQTSHERIRKFDRAASDFRRGKEAGRVRHHRVDM